MVHLLQNWHELLDENTAVYETNESTITTTVSEFEFPEEYKQIDPRTVKVKHMKRKVQQLQKSQNNKMHHQNKKKRQQ